MKQFLKLRERPGAKSELAQHMNHGKPRRWLWFAVLPGAFLAIAVIGTGVWYQRNITPLDASGSEKLFSVAEGDTAAVIAKKLHEQGLIRSELAFRVALRLSGEAANNIKVGAYRLSPAEDVRSILAKLESGIVDAAMLQLIPGKTLSEIRESLIEVGFDEARVDDALARDYDHPLLADKPVGASLEGYIYPDTYQVDLTADPSIVIEASLDNFHQKLQQAKLQNASLGGLSRHEAIILGSVIEKEVNTSEDRPIVAQVFLKRLNEDIQLGSDATFVYAARELGVAPRVDLESPYNTRVVGGLPPGPISNMTIDALIAIEEPSDTDFLYFVTADDNVTHYGRTLEEHEANIAQFCGVRCEL